MLSCLSRSAEFRHRLPMAHRPKRRRLADGYTFPGFRALATVRGVFGDPRVRVITLVRRSKKRSAAHAVVCTAAGTIAKPGASAISPAATRVSTSTSKSDASIVGAVVP
jgi:hypothetical protein